MTSEKLNTHISITTPPSPSPSQTQTQPPLPPLTPEQERNLVLKIDLHTIPIVAVLYALCTLDRVNIGNARLAGLEQTLSLTGTQYNTLLSTFYISYILCSIPAVHAVKLLGPGWALPGTTLVFGVLTVAFAFVRTLAQAAAVRLLLGVFEAGVFGGIAFYLSRWYARAELAFRLGLYVVMAPLSGAGSGLLAGLILRLERFGGVQGWGMIFAVEGVVTVVLALGAGVVMADGPETARWLTDEEKRMVVLRVRGKRGEAEVVEGFEVRRAVAGLGNPVVICTSIALGMVNMTVQGISFFTPTVVRTIFPDRSPIAQQLLTVPPFAVGAIATLLFSALSWRLDRRNSVMIAGALVSLTGFALFLGSDNTQTSLRYGAMFVSASGCFLFGALANAQVSAAVVSDTSRSSALGLNTMMGNLGGLVATWSYLPADAPQYRFASGLNVAFLGTVIILLVALGLWMQRDNRKREERERAGDGLEGLSADGRSLEYKHPSFRWKA